MKIAVFHSSRAILGQGLSGSGIYEKSIAELFDQLSSRENLEVCHFVPRKRGVRFRKLDFSSRSVYEFRSGLFERVASSWPGSFLAQVIEGTPLMSTSKFLRSERFDFAYFSSPSPLALRLGNFPYLFTVWDFGHLDLPGFHELWAQSTWVSRERIYSIGAGRASHVFVDSPETGMKLQKRFGIPRSRWTAIGLLPRIRESFDASREIRDDYIIYPAKFWPHKNHLTILRALAILKSNGVSLKLVLTGGDGGSRGKVGDEVSTLGLESDVLFLGQVDRQRLLSLVYNAVALVMPSLLGPTNLPPLEALQLGTPAIVSDAHSFGSEIDSLLRIVPGMDSAGWADEIGRLLNPPRRLKTLKFEDNGAIESHRLVFKEMDDFLERA